MDGRSAALRPVRVILSSAWLMIRDPESGAQLTQWDAAEIRVDALQEGYVVRLKLRSDPDALLTIRSRGVLAPLERAGARAQTVPGRNRPRLLYATALALAIAALVSLVYTVIPKLSPYLARAIPLDVERKLGAQMEGYLEEYSCGSSASREVLARLMTRLGAETAVLPSVSIINLSVENAFTFPGGVIVMTRGLVESAGSPDEVAGVLAHEAQHVLQRHVMTRLVRSTLLSTLWAVTMGDFSGLMVLDPSTLLYLATLSFSRDDEASADREAMRMLDRARIGRDGFRAFFERLDRKQGDMPEWLSTHPALSSRIEAAATARDPSATTPALGDSEWETLRSACSQAPEAEGSLFGL